MVLRETFDPGRRHSKDPVFMGFLLFYVIFYVIVLLIIYVVEDKQ